MIVETQFLAATDTDVLAGTRLDSIPSDGAITVYAASTQIDGTLTLAPPGQETVLRAQPIILRAGPEIRTDEDVGFQVFVPQGGHPLVAYTEVTAASMVIQIVFQTLEELGG